MDALDFHCLDILDIHKAKATRIRTGRSGVRGPELLRDLARVLEAQTGP